ncbi:hypothetical protein B0H34DRAFT_783015 [Crassisporium funariophilum]|nr:hypothetical protein B0H34DRAFT_783015 [Crassisporium funariophilum]
MDDLEGPELIESLQKEMEHKLSLLKELDLAPHKKISQKRGFGYNGCGKRTQQKHCLQAQEKAEKDAKCVKEASKMVPQESSAESPPTNATGAPNPIVTNKVFTGYISDLEEDKDEAQNPSSDVQEPPSCKQRRLEIPILELEKALIAINKLIESKKDVFVAGQNSLQAYQAQAIQLHLHMVVQNGRKHIEALQRAAKSQGLQRNGKWVTGQELPTSSCGAHGKAFPLLKDPASCAKLRLYLRSNKWSMDPMKLSEFVQGKSIPATAMHQLIDKEMPRGLMKYLELELFPCAQYQQVAKEITLQTMTVQQNNGKKKSWVLDGEHALKKKEVGHGIHLLGQTLEYGKNYKGYWTGELFVKQVNYQALFVIDNSQGHAAYAEDALLVSQMNLHPGGKQACMHNGCFTCDRVKVNQPMVFPPDHPEFPDQPKGMRQVIEEENFWRGSEAVAPGNCEYTFSGSKENLLKALKAVALETIQKWEHQMYWWVDAY